METLKVSYSGVRGIVGGSLTRQTAWRYGVSFGRLVASRDPEATILLARDTRPSGLWLREALLTGLAPFGFGLLDLSGIRWQPSPGRTTGRPPGGFPRRGGSQPDREPASSKRHFV